MEQNVQNIRKEFSRIDEDILRLCADRMRLAREIEREKAASKNARIIYEDVEERKYERFSSLATMLGINRYFAESLLYLLIAESARVQVKMRDERERNSEA